MISVAIGYDGNEQPWSHAWKRALQAGILAHGDSVQLTPMRDIKAGDQDVTVTWGLRGGRRQLMRRSMVRGKRHLTMERGFIGVRTTWTALTFDGIAGRGDAPTITDPARFEQHAYLMRPWRPTGGRRAMIMGQVTGDATIAHVNFPLWARLATVRLRAAGWTTTYRHHPQERAQRRAAPAGSTVLRDGPLAAALDQCDLVVTFNSTSAVEAALYGVPVFTADVGSPAWEVAAHRAFEPVQPDRLPWATKLVWRQWTIEEIRSGLAWGHLRTIAVLD